MQSEVQWLCYSEIIQVLYSVVYFSALIGMSINRNMRNVELLINNQKHNFHWISSFRNSNSAFNSCCCHLFIFFIFFYGGGGWGLSYCIDVTGRKKPSSILRIILKQFGCSCVVHFASFEIVLRPRYS